MSRTLQQIIDEPDYGVLDHSEILQLIEYKCEQAVNAALIDAGENLLRANAQTNQTTFEAIMESYSERLSQHQTFTVLNPFILPNDEDEGEVDGEE